MLFAIAGGGALVAGVIVYAYKYFPILTSLFVLLVVICILPGLLGAKQKDEDNKMSSL